MNMNPKELEIDPLIADGLSDGRIVTRRGSAECLARRTRSHGAKCCTRVEHEGRQWRSRASRTHSRYFSASTGELNVRPP
jgi:hypothetical protein